MPRKVATSTLVKNLKPCDGDDTIPIGPEKIMVDEISYTYKGNSCSKEKELKKPKLQDVENSVSY